MSDYHKAYAEQADLYIKQLQHQINQMQEAIELLADLSHCNPENHVKYDSIIEVIAKNKFAHNALSKRII